MLFWAPYTTEHLYWFKTESLRYKWWNADISNQEKQYTRAYIKLNIQIPGKKKLKAQLQMWKEMEILGSEKINLTCGKCIIFCRFRDGPLIICRPDLWGTSV